MADAIALSEVMEIVSGAPAGGEVSVVIPVGTHTVFVAGSADGLTIKTAGSGTAMIVPTKAWSSAMIERELGGKTIVCDGTGTVTFMCMKEVFLA